MLLFPNPNSTLSWNSSTLGIGISPADFTNPVDVFIVQSGHTMTTTGIWAIAGSLQINGTGSFTTGSNSLWTMSIPGTTTISGTLTGAGTATKTFTGNITVNTGGIFDITGACLVQIAGSFTNSGTVTTIATSTVEYNGASAQTIYGMISPGYGNLTLSNNAVKTAGDTLFVRGDLLINAGSTLHGASPATYSHHVGGNWVNNGIFTPGTCTMDFNSSTIGKTISGTLTGTSKFNKMSFNNGGGWTFMSKVEMSSNLTITSGTLTAPADTITIGGKWNNQGNFIAGTSTVNFISSLTATTITGSPTGLTGNNKFNKIIFNGSGDWIFKAPAEVASDITIANGTVKDSLLLTVGGNWTNNGGTFTPGIGTVTFNGTGTQSITGTAASETFNSIVINKTVATLLNTGGNITMLTIDDLTQTLGNFTAPATLNISGDFTHTAGTFTPGTGTVTFNGTGTQSISSPASSETFYNVTVNKTAGTLNTAGSITMLIGNDFTNTLGNFSAPATFNINGNFLHTAGTFTAGTNTNIKGNWTRNGGTFAPGSNTVTFTGIANQAIGGTVATTFNNLIINPSAGITVSPVTSSPVVNSNLTVSTGIFDLGILNCNRASGGGTLAVAASATLRLANNTGGPSGSNFPNNFTTNTLNASSTVEYYGANSITQTVYATPVYGHLILTNSTGSGIANKISTAAISAVGNTIVNGLVNFSLGGGFATGTSFGIASTGELYCGANLVTGAGSFTLNQGGILGIGHANGIASSGASGNIQNTGTRSFNNDAGYIYNGSVNQTTGNGLNSNIGNTATDGVRNLTVNNSGASGSNIVTLSNDVQVNTTSTAAQGVFNIGSGRVLYIKNSIIKTSGLYDGSNGTLNMSGTVAQTLSGGIFSNKKLKNLIISNTATGTVLTVGSTTADSLKLTGQLSFGAVSGKTFNTGDNITLVSTSTVTANVGDLTGNTISGKATVERYINTGTSVGQHLKSWQLLSAPTVGQSVYNSWQEGGSVAPGYGSWITGPSGSTGLDAVSSTPSMKYYDASTNNFIGVTNSSNLINNTKGYFLFVRGDRTVTTFSGAPVPTTLRTTGTLYQPGAAPASVTVNADKYESAGNPYASQVDFTQLSRTGGVDNKFYAWDPTLSGSYGVGGYQTISSTNSWIPVPAGGQYAGVHKTIESGQAFFVHATSSAGTISFTETAKTGSGIMVSRPQQINGDMATRQFIRTTLLTNTGVIADGNAVAFDTDLSNRVDGDDALKILNGGENFGLSREGKALAIEGRSPVADADTLFYYMSNLRQQAYRLAFAPQGMYSSVDAFLVDKFLNTSTLINLAADSSFADFTVSSNAASSAADRFMVVFKLLTPLPVTLTTIAASRNADKTISVNWHSENEINLIDYAVERSGNGNSFSSLGTQTPATNNGGSAAYLYKDANPLGGDNYYRIKALSRSGQSQYSAIVKVAPVKQPASISVYPNPVVDKIMVVKFISQPFGNYQVTLSNQPGQSIYHGYVSVSSSNFVKTIELAAGTAAGNYQLTITAADGGRTVQQVVIL